MGGNHERTRSLLVLRVKKFVFERYGGFITGIHQIAEKISLFHLGWDYPVGVPLFQNDSCAIRGTPFKWRD